ncbi:30S ribosomal protein S2, partial [mine drainage metagenome]
HIGTQQKSASMRRFVHKVRFDGLHVLNIRETDRRIRLAAAFLARFPADKILTVSQRQYGQKPVRIFAKQIGAVSFADRFVPGCLTNPSLAEYFEPKVLVVTDPATDQQALSEAVSIGIPVVGLCDVNNETRDVDLVIPANNEGPGRPGHRVLAVDPGSVERPIAGGRGSLPDDDGRLRGGPLAHGSFTAGSAEAPLFIPSLPRFWHGSAGFRTP